MKTTGKPYSEEGPRDEDIQFAINETVNTVVANSESLAELGWSIDNNTVKLNSQMRKYEVYDLFLDQCLSQ